MAKMLYLHSLAIDPYFRRINLASYLFTQQGIKWMEALCWRNGLTDGILLTVDYFNSKGTAESLPEIRAHPNCQFLAVAVFHTC